MKKKVLALLLSASMAVGIAANPMEGMEANAAAYPQEDAAENAAAYLEGEAAENIASNLEDVPAQLAENTGDWVEQADNMEDWDWAEQGDGTISIISYKGNAAQVEVPSILDGREVTEIGCQVFYGNETMTDITIPNTIKVIQEEAFAYCSGLNHVTLPEGVVSLEDDAFYCAGLASIALPESLEKIGENTFAGCENLLCIQIPDQVISIGGNAFSCCNQLEDVIFPKSLKKIEEGTFDGCENLRYIEIPDSVVSIGDRAFSSCDKLKYIKFSKSLEEIGESAFSYCASLEELDFPEGLMVIGASAFSECSALANIILPNSLARIGSQALERCSCLTDIYIPGNVTSIESDAFLGCDALEKIDVAGENAVFSSLDGVLFNQEKTELLRFPGGKDMESYEVPSSVQKIGDYAFGNEEDTTGVSISMPDSVQEIGAYAFCGYGAGDIRLPKDLKSIRDYAFAYSSCEEIEIPSGVTHIGQGAFSDSDSLTSIHVDAANPSFCSQDGILFDKEKTGLFAYPGGITREKYSVPSGVARILPRAFSGNENLKEVLLPGSVLEIGQYAFKDMELTEVTIVNPQCVIGEGGSDEGSDYDEVFSSNVKINGYRDSTAQAYAQKYGIPFQSISGEICEHEYKEIVTTPPTCVQKGIKTFTCSKCGDSYTDEIPMDLTAHEYTEQVTWPSTCSQIGVKEYICSICGDSYTKKMPMVGHDYQMVTVKATTSKDGSIQKKCKFCGDVSEVVPIAYPKAITISKPSVTYNGKAQKISVNVKDSAGKAVASTHYSVSYSSNKNVGEATVTIKFRGNYTGSVKKTFRILPKGTSLSKISAKSKGFLAKWKKQAAQTDGYQIQYSTNSKFKGKDTKTVSIKKNGTTSKSVSKLKAKKKYYVRIRTYKAVKIKGKNVTLYSAWSKAKAIKTKK